MLRTRNLDAGYGKLRVLKNVSVHVKPGEIVSIIGGNGAGKTTLLSCVAGLLKPQAGEVWLGETPLSRLDEGARTRFRRHHIGFVFQFFNLIPTLTIEENLLLPLELVGRLDDAPRARELLAAVGLSDRARAVPDRLSGGEQQRVALARALVHRPRLLLADEPTGTLDAETGDRVLALLQHLVRAGGMTLITVTHSREVAAAADRVFRLAEGQLHAVDRLDVAGV